MPGGEGDQVPTEFRIFSMGVNESEKGSFLFDSLAADSVMDEYRRHDKPMLLDFNHGTTYAAPTPEQAISAGEFVPEVRADGLWATGIKWTDRAAAALKAREYRLFSPYFEHDPKTRRVLRLINVALTNLPALDGIAPLMAASATHEGDEPMEELEKLKAQIAALTAQVGERDTKIRSLEETRATAALTSVVGLAATSGDAEVRTAVAQLVTFKKNVLEALGKKDEGTAIGALNALKEKETEVENLRKQIKTTEEASLSQEWKSYLDTLSTAGEGGKYLPTGKREKAEKIALSIGGGVLTRAGIDGAKEFVVAMLDARAGGPGVSQIPGAAGLDSEAIKMLAVQGVNPADFMKFEAGRIAAGGSR